MKWEGERLGVMAVEGWSVHREGVARVELEFVGMLSTDVVGVVMRSG